MQDTLKYLTASIRALLVTCALAPAAVAQGGTAGETWLGFGISCSDCGSQQLSDRTIAWFFSAPPVVVGFDASGPAARAGLRAGDVLTHLDGVSLTTPEGGQRFGQVAPGQPLEWTYTRGGVVGTARMTVGLRASARRREATTAPDSYPIRFSGDVGDLKVEVRGTKVSVAIDESTGEVLIRGTDLWVRLRPDSLRQFPSSRGDRSGRPPEGSR